ncbi:MAG: U32 family peptidase C-terminal domain-containing protein [Patescibacteria group bacterium]|nr:U32 family peptidase C-terminal domain-containing protein [Patescibacteria group bacterium]
MKKPELILPGGDLERVKIAFQYGADAVYVGLNEYSLRKAEVRFELSEVKEAIDHAHSLNKRLFVTFNIFAHNEHLKRLESDMKKVASFYPDAFIIADPGIVALAQKIAPNIPIHLSTQANTLNIESVKFWKKQGIKRIVLARELTLDEIKNIHTAAPEMELEIFVHGAMCISYSGRCLLSRYMTGREANLGDCAQPCRWNYRVYSSSDREKSSDVNSSHIRSHNNFFLEERMRPGELYPIEENENGTSVMGSKDLRLIRYLPEILEAGVTGLKIEGRNKSEYYLASTASTYRRALDLLKSSRYTEKDKKILEAELEKLNFRDYTTGFLFDDAKLGEVTENRRYKKTWEYIGIFTDNKNEILVKNKIMTDDKVEVLSPHNIYQDIIIDIYDLTNNKMEEINPGAKEQKAIIKLSKNYSVNSILRKKL